jgi:hypothetical protein
MENHTMFINYIVKMSILLTAVYRFNTIPVKMPITFLQKKTNNFKIHGNNNKKIWNAISRKKNKSVGIPLPDFQLYRKAIETQIYRAMRHNRHPEPNPCT